VLADGVGYIASFADSQEPSVVSDWLVSLTWRSLITDWSTSVIVSDQDYTTYEAGNPRLTGISPIMSVIVSVRFPFL